MAFLRLVTSWGVADTENVCVLMRQKCALARPEKFGPNSADSWQHFCGEMQTVPQAASNSNTKTNKHNTGEKHLFTLLRLNFLHLQYFHIAAPTVVAILSTVLSAQILLRFIDCRDAGKLLPVSCSHAPFSVLAFDTFSHLSPRLLFALIAFLWLGARDSFGFIYCLFDCFIFFGQKPGIPYPPYPSVFIRASSQR